MADFSIRIRGAIPAEFVPADGKPWQLTRLDDNIGWGNATGATHQPWPATPHGVPLPDADVLGTPHFLSDEIPRRTASNPWRVTKSITTGNTIFYCCKLHEGEFGVIVIVE